MPRRTQRSPGHPAHLLVVLLALLVAPPARGDTPGGSPLARAALQACEQAVDLPATGRIARFDQGLLDAELAIAADPTDPVAHFAAFCHRGRRLELEGAGLSTLGTIRAARRALDRSLELAPDYAAALTAKGSFLLRLPRLLGGNPTEGVRLLQRAIALSPDDPTARQLLTDLAPGAAGDAAACAPSR